MLQEEESRHVPSVQRRLVTVQSSASIVPLANRKEVVQEKSKVKIQERLVSALLIWK